MIDGDGDGGDCGDLGCGGWIAAADASGSGGFAGPGPCLPNLKRLEINGAPIVETSHEYVIKKSDALNR